MTTVSLNAADLPDLHSQAPAIALPIRRIGHRGVRRPLRTADHAYPLMVTIDVGVGLHAGQRGAHMSRLIDVLPFGVETANLAAYVMSALESLRERTPDCRSWYIDAVGETVLDVSDGVKPITEQFSVAMDAEGEPSLSWTVTAKVALACPQAQAVIAFDREDIEIGRHPSHNQVCDISVRLVGLPAESSGLSAAAIVALAETCASGPVRERFKRRGEADVVTQIHHNARFAEDCLRMLASQVRELVPTAGLVECSIVNYESIFEYPLECVVEA
jgi:GTP cyclohydrolase FolE2